MKRHLLFCTLLGILLLALPKVVQADTFDLSTANPDGVGGTTGVFVNDKPFAGVQLGTGIGANDGVRWWNSGSWTSNVAGAAGSTYDFNGKAVTITDVGVTMDGKGAAAIATNDTTGTFRLGNIFISGQVVSDELAGFVYRNNDDFTGMITGGNITVEATNGSSAYGAYFRDTRKIDGTSSNPLLHPADWWANITNDVSFETINVRGDDEAVGFVASVISGNVTLDNVTAQVTDKVNGSFALGVQIDSIASTGTLTVNGKLDARGANEPAAARETMALNIRGDIALGGTAKIGSLNAESALHHASGAVVSGLLSGTLEVGAGGITVNAKENAYGIRTMDGVRNMSVKGDIDVTSEEVQAYGIQMHGFTLADSTINIGNITARGNGNGAAGFAAYGASNAGDVSLGNVTAEGQWASGVHFLENVTGELKIGNINVTSGPYEAHGLAVGDYNGVVEPSNLTGATSVGAINVTSTEIDNGTDMLGANAFGIRAGRVSDLKLNGNINVTGTGGETSGIRTYDGTSITLGNNVTIDTTYTGITGPSPTWAGADIWTTGNLNIDLKQYDLTTTNRVKVEGGDLSVIGFGTADLGTVYVERDHRFYIGNNYNPDNPLTGAPDKTTVRIDGARMLAEAEEGAWLGDVVFRNPNGTLEIYGNTDQYEVKIGRLLVGDSRQVVSKSTFTRWGLDGDDFIIALGVSDKAYANDNYLAAAMIHHKYTAWHAVRDHVISGANRIQQGQYGYYGQAPCDCLISCSHGCAPAKPRGAWGNYVGRDSRYRSSYSGNDWHFATHGVQLGTDFFRTYRGQLGVFFGYEDSTGSNRTAANTRDRLASKDYYVGLYGVHVFRGGADLRTIFNFGWQDYSSRRNGVDNVNYQSTFGGNTAELNIELGKRFYYEEFRGMWSIRPAIAIDWYLNRLDGGVETPSWEHAIRYHSTDISQLFFRFGTDLRYESGRWAVEGGLFYSYDMRGSDLWAGVSDAQTNRFTSALVGSKVGRSALSFNLGGSYLVCNNLTVFGGYRGEANPDRAGCGYINTGYIGGAWRW